MNLTLWRRRHVVAHDVTHLSAGGIWDDGAGWGRDAENTGSLDYLHIYTYKLNISLYIQYMSGEHKNTNYTTNTIPNYPSCRTVYLSWLKYIFSPLYFFKLSK